VVLVVVAVASVPGRGMTVVRTSVGVVVVVAVLGTTVRALGSVVVRGTRARSSSVEALGTVVDTLDALIDLADDVCIVVGGRECKRLHADGLAVVSLERELKLEDGDEERCRVGELQSLDFDNLWHCVSVEQI
jgi:hypothetical protein